MSRTLQFKRYANTVIAQITGAPGELIIDTTNKVLTIHDGITPGGFSGSAIDSVARASASAAAADADAADYSASVAQAKAQAAYNYANTIVSDTLVDPLARENILVVQGVDTTQNTRLVVIQGTDTSQNVRLDYSNTRMTIIEGVNATQNTNITAAAQTVPQNAQSEDYTLQLTDAGKHIYYTQSSNTKLYVPWTSNVGFSNGTTIMIVSKTTSNANVTVSPNVGVTMYLAGNTVSTSRNVITYGVATLIQVASNTWFISGAGVA